MKKIKFFKFYTEVKGYTFHNKITGKQVYKYEMFAWGLTSIQCFQMFNTQKIEIHEQRPIF